MKILKYDAIQSTNLTLLELSKEGTKSWTVLWTSNQTGGRGYAGNSWQSEPGKNLSVSFLINHQLKYEELIFFNQWVSNAVWSLVKRFSDEVYVKWPNDIILNDKKICGILIETRKNNSQLSIVTGIGLNVNQTNFDNFPKASSLSGQLDRKFDLNEILSGLMVELKESFDLIENKEWNKISEQYNSELYRKGIVSQFKSKDKVFSGIITGVDNLGTLNVQMPEGKIKSFRHKEIELLY